MSCSKPVALVLARTGIGRIFVEKDADRDIFYSKVVVPALGRKLSWKCTLYWW